MKLFNNYSQKLLAVGIHEQYKIWSYQGDELL